MYKPVFPGAPKPQESQACLSLNGTQISTQKLLYLSQFFELEAHLLISCRYGVVGWIPRASGVFCALYMCLGSVFGQFWALLGTLISPKGPNMSTKNGISWSILGVRCPSVGVLLVWSGGLDPLHCWCFLRILWPFTPF